MARYKAYNLKQDKWIPLSYADQIVRGSFEVEYALNEIVEEHLDLSVFEPRYRNDETGRLAYDPKVLLEKSACEAARGLRPQWCAGAFLRRPRSEEGTTRWFPPRASPSRGTGRAAMAAVPCAAPAWFCGGTVIVACSAACGRLGGTALVPGGCKQAHAC